MASRSRFYVDTPPCEPKQRHSMYVTHSELVQTQDLPSNTSSSSTLPSAAGSVDRLTGLEEKKSSRFFTLKPKTSFSLRPFFRSSSSLASLSPGKRRKASLERRDSCVQTEESRPEFGEVGVQTLNASTVDVPVQTCLEAWEEGDSYGHRRFAYASARASPFWSRPSVASSALSKPLLPKNVPKDPLASPKFIKYAVPGVSEKTALHHQSAVSSPVDVNSCQPVLPSSQSISSDTSASVAVKYFSAKELSGKDIPLTVNAESQPAKKPTNVSSNESDQNSNPVPLSVKENEKSETAFSEGYVVSDNQTSEVSNDSNISVSSNVEHPLSVLKIERTDSPSRRLKTVHFELSEPESSKKLASDSSKPRNVDKDFEALLRDLNVLTEDDLELPISLNSVSREKSLSSNLISPNFNSVLEALREDFLAPIPENLNECTENETNTLNRLNRPDGVNNDNKTDTIKIETINSNSTAIVLKHPLTRSDSVYENQNELNKCELNTEFKSANSANVNKINEADLKVETINENVKPNPFKGPQSILNSEFENKSKCYLSTDSKSGITGDVNKSGETSLEIETVNANFNSEASKEPLIFSSSGDIKHKNQLKQNTDPKLANFCDVNKDNKIGDTAGTENSNFNRETLKEPLTPPISKYEFKNAGISKNDSAAPTSLSAFTSANSGSNPETEGNVYDKVIEEENLVKTVPLPILPSFFGSSLHAHDLEVRGSVEYAKSNSAEVPSDNQQHSAMPLDTEFDRNRLSRSSSRSSIKSNSKSGQDSLRESMSRFDSCENLDQLEEEIIRSLYSPDEGKLEDSIMKNIELPPSESFQNSGTAATHMRRVILDQLLNGKNVEDIVPNYPQYQRAHSVPEKRSKHKPPTKYTAVLTKMCHDDNENSFTIQSDLDSPFYNNSSKFEPTLNFRDEKENSSSSDVKHISAGSSDSLKKTSSVFLFPGDNNLSNKKLENPAVEISANGHENKGSSILEVRRSSWTPQTTVDSTSCSAERKNSAGQEKTSDNKSDGQCDFTNCLRPSKIQNSPFLAKINSRSMSPCSFSPVPTLYNTPPCNNDLKRDNSPQKQPEAIGECDFASCLKPSQVQNSLFTAELSEITSGKSTNSLRAVNPFTVRTYSPLPPRSSSLDNPSSTPVSIEEKFNREEDSIEPVKHKSECVITLRTPAKHSNVVDNKTDFSQNTGTVENLDMLQSDPSVGKTSNSNEEQKIDCLVPPPPPPPPPSSTPKSVVCTKECSLESMIQDQKSNLTTVEAPMDSKNVTLKTSVMVELGEKLQNKNDSHRRNSNDKIVDECLTTTDGEDDKITNAGRSEIKLNGSFDSVTNGNQNGTIGILSSPREFDSSLPNDENDRNSYGTTKLTFSPNTVITDEPPPPGAVLLDKKVTIDGDKVHTDRFYAIPVKEVLKEKTSTTTFIPAPPKYEGIGPTEEGIPTGLRNSVKKENMHNWYKTMFKSLHKADSSNDSQEYIIGYTSEPETSKKDIMVRKKSSTLDNRMKHDINSNYNKQNYPPSAKSSIEVYNVRPRLIEDYEPGYSSVTDDTVTTSKRYLPSANTVKPSYEFKNGYESDSNITKKRDQPEGFSTEQQKMWYREIQKGGEIPQFGLGKPAPEKPKEPSIGPVPPPPLNYNGSSCQQAVRPLTLPANYSNQNGNGYCQQMNGAYEMHMRHAIHSEMQQRRSPSSNQLSPPIRTMMKSPSRSPDMKIPAQALFDFKAESPKEIPLKKGDTVLILRQLDKNWYEGEHKGVVGIFPISYVEIVPPEHACTPVKTTKPEGLGRALYDFVAQTSIELTVRKGDSITLLRRVDANWFEGIFNDKKGIVPISYIQVLQEPIDRNMGSPSQKSCTISPSNLESKEKLQKANSMSPSAYSSSSISPLPVHQERRKLLSKKVSNLIEPIMYRALYSYNPQNSDELELQEGDTVYVVEMCDDGWYVGTSVRNGVFGIFPGNYVEKAC